MKIPAPPPDIKKIEAEIFQDTALLTRLVIEMPHTGTLPDYLPWDKLRYRKPPEGITHEQWWYILKMGRRQALRPLPLNATDGDRFSYALPDKVLRLTDEITRRASGQIAISEQVTNPATRDRYIVSSLIEEAITSSQLEGAATSRQVAKEMIRSGRPPRDKSERMILNNFFAMQHISAIAKKNLTPELICEIHRIVTEGTLEDPIQAGKLQSDPDPGARVAVFGSEDQIIHRPPPVADLPARIEALCKFANNSNDGTYIHPVLRALTIHFMMGYDHYFEDGNGRTARALFYWSMLHEGFWLTEFITISKILKTAPAQYARSFVLTEQDDGDLTYFFLYHLRIIQRAIDELDVYLTRKMNEIRRTRVLLASTPGEFNYRQLDLLEAAIKDSSLAFTIASHALSHNVSHETARQDLADLTERGLLDRTREAKKYVWRPAKELSSKLRSGQDGGLL